MRWRPRTVSRMGSSSVPISSMRRRNSSPEGKRRSSASGVVRPKWSATATRWSVRALTPACWSFRVSRRKAFGVEPLAWKCAGARWWRTRATTCRTRSFGARSRPRKDSVGATPSSSWRGERMRPPSSTVTAGLPRSWQSAPNITTRSSPSSSIRAAAASSTTRSVCSHTVPSGCQWGSCGTPTIASSSGKNLRSAVRRRNSRPSEGRRPFRSNFRNSSKRRSPGSSSRSSAAERRSSSSSASIAKRAANCATRSPRRGSSAKCAGSVARRTPRSRSAFPPCGSRSSPVKGSSPMLLMVRSRRRAASAKVSSGSSST